MPAPDEETQSSSDGWGHSPPYGAEGDTERAEQDAPLPNGQGLAVFSPQFHLGIPELYAPPHTPVVSEGSPSVHTAAVAACGAPNTATPSDRGGSTVAATVDERGVDCDMQTDVSKAPEPAARMRQLSATTMQTATMPNASFGNGPTCRSGPPDGVSGLGPLPTFESPSLHSDESPQQVTEPVSEADHPVELTRGVGGFWAPPVLRQGGRGAVVKCTLAEARQRCTADHIFGFMLREADDRAAAAEDDLKVDCIFVMYGARINTDPDWVYYSKMDFRGDWHSCNLMAGIGGLEYQVHRIDFEGDALRAYRVPVGHYAGEPSEMRVLDIVAPPPLVPQESIVWWTSSIPAVPGDGRQAAPVDGSFVTRKWGGELVFAHGSLTARPSTQIQPWKIQPSRYPPSEWPDATSEKPLCSSVLSLGTETVTIEAAMDRCLRDPRAYGFCFTYHPGHGGEEPPKDLEAECSFFAFGAELVEPQIPLPPQPDLPVQARYTKGWNDYTFRGTMVQRTGRRPRFAAGVHEQLDCECDLEASGGFYFDAGRSKYIEEAKRRVLKDRKLAGFYVRSASIGVNRSGSTLPVEPLDKFLATDSHAGKTQPGCEDSEIEVFFFTEEQYETAKGAWEETDEWTSFVKQGLVLPPPGRGFATEPVTITAAREDELRITFRDGRVGTLRRRYRPPLSRYSMKELERTLCYEVFGRTRRGNSADEPYNVVDSSLYIMHPRNEWRKRLVRVIDHPLFDRVVLVLIILNACLLVLDPKSVPDLADQEWLQEMLHALDLVFQIAFTIEAALKIAALGFVMHRNSYLRSMPDPFWNRMDFVIVIAGWLGKINLGGDFTAFRLLRCLRPLRTMNRHKPLRRLISTLIAAIPVAIDVFMLFFLLMWVFAILGIQLWAGSFHQRCYVTAGWDGGLRLNASGMPMELPCVNGTEPGVCHVGDAETVFLLRGNVSARHWLVFNDTAVCSASGLGRSCSSNELRLPQECAIDEAWYKRRVGNFDNMGTSLVLTFQLMSLDDWPQTMKDAQDAVGHHAWIYFFLATLLGNILAVNLILAALATEYGQQKVQRSHRPLPLIHSLKPATLLGALTGHSALVVAMPSLVQERQRELDFDDEDDDEEDEEDFFTADEELDPQNPVPEAAAEDLPQGANLAREVGERVVRGINQRGAASDPFGLAADQARLQSEEAPRDPSHLDLGTAPGGSLRTGWVAAGSGRVRANSLAGRKRGGSLRAASFTSSVGSSQVLLASMQSFDDLPGPVWKAASPEERRAQHEKETRRRLRRQGYWQPGTAGHTLFRVTRSKLFGWFVFGTTITNTVMLSMDHYNIDPTWRSVINWINFLSSYVFLVEAVLKLIGLTPSVYFTDNYNRFDFLLVVVSIFDMMDPNPSGGGSALTALRGLRLARVFRLAKKWKALNKILSQIAQAVVQVGYLSIVMMLFLFIYSVMGVQLFSCDSVPGVRCGFENLAMSALTVFIVITGENWATIMKETIIRTSWGAALYFVTLFLLGNYILLNLFIAILIDAFADSDSGEGSESFCEELLRLCPCDPCCIRPQPAEDEKAKESSALPAAANEPVVDPADDSPVDRALNLAAPGSSSPSGLVSSGINAWEAADNTARDMSPMEQKALRAMGVGVGVSRLPPSPTVASKTSSPAAGATPLRRRSIDSPTQESAPGRRKSRDGPGRSPRRRSRSPSAIQRQSSLLSTASWPTAAGGSIAGLPMPGSSPGVRGDRRVSVFAKEGTQLEVKPIPGKSTLHARGFVHCKPSAGEAGGRRRSDSGLSLLAQSEVADGYEDLPEGIEKTEFAPFREPRPCDDVIYAASAFFEPAIKQDERDKRVQYETVPCCGSRMPSSSRVRVWARSIVNWPHFDAVVIIVIVLNLVFIALESPATEDNRPVLFDVLRVGDFVFVALFTVEMVIKIVAWGWEGFFTDPWNGMDAFVVVSSIVGLFVNELRSFRSLRIMRLVTLGASDMKFVLTTILHSLDGIQTVFFVSTMIYFIFATVGTQLFMGYLYECSNPEVRYEADCRGNYSHEVATAFGTERRPAPAEARWEKYWFTFDDVFESMFTLFMISVGEKWREMLYRTMDAPAAGEAPRHNANAWIAAIFYVVFVVLGQFFFQNLFIGILIQKFDESNAARGFYRDEDEMMGNAVEQWRQAQSILSSAHLLEDIPPPHYMIKARWWLQRHGTDRWGRWVEPVAADAGDPGNDPMSPEEPDPGDQLRFAPPPDPGAELPRVLLIAIDTAVRATWFDTVTTIAILLNAVAMALQHYNQPHEMDDFLWTANWCFVVIFTVEAALKLTAFSCGYFTEGWNRFDFLIVLVSWVAVLSSSGSTSGIRVLRIMRMLRLLKRAEGLKMVFDTTISALPELVNIATLLLMVFFIFGVFGVDLFGRIAETEQLNQWSNFDNLYRALVTLYQVSTTETWNDILHGTTTQHAGCADGADECGVSPRLARGVLVIFLLLGSFVFLNLFVYVLIENYVREKNARRVKLERQSDLEPLHALRSLWLTKDPKGTGLISADACLEVLRQLPEPLWLKSAWALVSYFGGTANESGRQAAVDFKRSAFLSTQRQLRAMLIPLNKDMQVRHRDVVRTLSLRAFGLRVREMTSLKVDPRDEMLVDLQSQARCWSLHHYHAAQFVRTRWWRFRANLREDRLEERCPVRRGLTAMRLLHVADREAERVLDRALEAWLAWHDRDDGSATAKPVPGWPEGLPVSLAAVAACLHEGASASADALEKRAAAWRAPVNNPFSDTGGSGRAGAMAASVTTSVGTPLAQTLPVTADMLRPTEERSRISSRDTQGELRVLRLLGEDAALVMSGTDGYIWQGSLGGGPAELKGAFGACLQGRWHALEGRGFPEPLGSGDGVVAEDVILSLGGRELARGTLERWGEGPPYIADPGASGEPVERDELGRPHGCGRVVLWDGTEHCGELCNGLLTGAAKQELPAADTGPWRLRGTVTAPQFLDGQFEEGACRHGTRIIEGQLVDDGMLEDVRHGGYRRVRLVRGSREAVAQRVRCTGCWRGPDRDPEDQGTLRAWPDRDAEAVHLQPDGEEPIEVWRGNFSLWHLQGKGRKELLTTGVVMEGVWKNSRLSDSGSILYSSGVRVHCINFRRGKAHGRTTLSFPPEPGSPLLRSHTGGLSGLGSNRGSPLARSYASDLFEGGAATALALAQTHASVFDRTMARAAAEEKVRRSRIPPSNPYVAIFRCGMVWNGATLEDGTPHGKGEGWLQSGIHFRGLCVMGQPRLGTATLPGGPGKVIRGLFQDGHHVRGSSLSERVQPLSANVDDVPEPSYADYEQVHLGRDHSGRILLF
eukprot:TRINITY_DN8240_c0_g1_i1.p1 TRINITY_DN8240_c0_g1~~TRINITY_DN8240_c0_g1_i1.p1  ORF type:complete len:3304 (+),score=906.06 TRINITY_DN8240_c0_g1_i1:185-10096(+)